MFAVLGWFDCCGWCVSYAGCLCGFDVGWCCAVAVWIVCGMLCFMFGFGLAVLLAGLRLVAACG